MSPLLVQFSIVIIIIIIIIQPFPIYLQIQYNLIFAKNYNLSLCVHVALARDNIKGPTLYKNLTRGG